MSLTVTLHEGKECKCFIKVEVDQLEIGYMRVENLYECPLHKNAEEILRRLINTLEACWHDHGGECSGMRDEKFLRSVGLYK